MGQIGVEVLNGIIYNRYVNIRPYIKIDNKWYRSICDNCETPVQSLRPKLCRDCFIDSIKGKKRVVHDKPHTEKTKELISKNRKNKGLHKGIRYNNQHDEFHHKWKGDEVGYGALHDWVKRRLTKKMECSKCGIKSNNPRKIHWANISREYKRDTNDWIELCAKCHKAYDMGRLEVAL